MTNINRCPSHSIRYLSKLNNLVLACPSHRIPQERKERLQPCTVYSVEYFKKPYIKLRKSFPSSSSNVQKSNKLDVVVLSCVQYSASGSETSPHHQPKPITTDEAGSKNLLVILVTIVTNSILLVRADTNRDGHDLPFAWLINLECQGNLFYLD